MSKSTGNFITLRDAVDKFSADGFRFALALAGDGNDDANLTFDDANTAVLNLYNFVKWCSKMFSSLQSMRGGKKTFFDNKTCCTE